MEAQKKSVSRLEPVCRVCSVETCDIYAECKGLVDKNGN